MHGGAGFGKTLAVNICLRALEPGEDVRKITFRARPTARAVRYELFTALDLAGEPPRHPSEFDRLLKMALAERPRTFLVDEAQWLNGEASNTSATCGTSPPPSSRSSSSAGRAATPCCAVNRCSPPASSSGSTSPASIPTRSLRPSPCSTRSGLTPSRTISVSSDLSLWASFGPLADFNSSAYPSITFWASRHAVTA
ncbi:ATP-binding protein [Streptomyces hygroscopicus]|uniref:ATP-binding protein n=1 Tax=Streptomyces hygroscopicus TaxID=1912 RepID=UPI0034045380